MFPDSPQDGQLGRKALQGKYKSINFARLPQLIKAAEVKKNSLLNFAAFAEAFDNLQIGALTDRFGSEKYDDLHVDHYIFNLFQQSKK
jgi:hypothetical protein